MSNKPEINTFNDLKIEISRLKAACEAKEDELKDDGNAILNAMSYRTIQARLKENLLGNLWKGVSIGYYIFNIYKNITVKRKA